MKFTRKEIWQHNSFFGSAVMTEKNMSRIIRSDTATPEAKQIATLIWYEAQKLYDALKKRVDQ
jgi:hypothetical protein